MRLKDSVLVFDEPTNGLDPLGIAETSEVIRDLAQKGKTIILASHLLEEVEKVCTHVAILRRGELLMAGDVNEVLTNEDFIELGAGLEKTSMLEQLLSGLPGAKLVKTQNEHIQVYFEKETMDPAEVNRYCYEQGVVLKHLKLKKKSLGSKFIELTDERAGKKN